MILNDTYFEDLPSTELMPKGLFVMCRFLASGSFCICGRERVDNSLQTVSERVVLFFVDLKWNDPMIR